MALAVLFIGFPSIVLLSQSIGMIITIRKLEDFRSKTSANSRNSIAGRKAFILYIAMYIKFVMFSYPYFVLNFIYDINPSLFKTQIPKVVIRIFLLTRFVPCLINPCMYSLKNRDYRRAIRPFVRFFNPKQFRLTQHSYSKRFHRSMTTQVSEETRL